MQSNGHDPAPITVVPLTLTHLPGVRALYGQLIAEKRPPYPIIDTEELDNFTRCLASCLIHPEQRERWPGWVALHGDTVVGFLFGEREYRPVGKPHDIYVAHWMVVDPAHRGWGIGRALSRAGLAWLTARNVPLIELASFAGDDQWAARGWTPIMTRYILSTEQVAALAQPRPVDRTEEAPHGSQSASPVE